MGGEGSRAGGRLGGGGGERGGKQGGGARTWVGYETYRSASFDPAMANICEVPDHRMSSRGILRPEPPSSSTPSAPMAALIPRSHTSARKVYLKYSPLYGFL